MDLLLEALDLVPKRIELLVRDLRSAPEKQNTE